MFFYHHKKKPWTSDSLNKTLTKISFTSLTLRILLMCQTLGFDFAVFNSKKFKVIIQTPTLTGHAGLT